MAWGAAMKRIGPFFGMFQAPRGLRQVSGMKCGVGVGLDVIDADADAEVDVPDLAEEDVEDGKPPKDDE